MAPLLGEAGPEALAGVYLGEGRWPFPAEVEGFRAYEALKPRREALREGISRELERLGLAPFPEGAPFGQRTIDLRFDRPLREAEAKGEIVRSIGSAPNRAYSFPLDDLALSALRRTWESMKAASVLSSFDLPGLDLRPFGEIGALRAERGSLALPGGSILAVLALRDPGSGALAFAEASLWNPEQGKKALGPGELKGILLREGFPSAGEEAFGLRQKERLLDLLWESRGFELGERRLGFGVVLSRGPEGSSTGRVVFDPAEAGPGLVAALPGEGSFPRVPGAASARIPSARWGWELGRRVLVVPSWRRGKPKMGPGGLQMSGLIPSGDLVLREGDWIRASRGGEVELAARFGPDILAAAWALERIRSGASQDLEWLEGWGPEVEDFIYSEAVWNPVYAGKRFRILDRLKALSKGPAVFEWGASRDGAFGRSSWPEAQAHARRPLWTRLEARLGKAADKSGLLRVLRRMLRRDFGGRPLLKLVFVCTGNTCRSPMAEQMSRELFEREGIDGVEVLSAGFLSALFEDGMSPLSAEAMAGLGFHPRPHAARELGPELVRSADFILAMEDVHVWAILRRFPEAASKVMLFSEFAGLGMKPIPDPVFRARPEPLGPEEGFSEAMAMNLEARGRRAPSLDSLSYSYGEAASAILLAVEGAARRLKSLRRLIEIDAKAREDKLARVSAARPPLLGLDAIDGDFASVAGEEAAALSEAALAARAAGARVAGGFALTAWAFEEFLRENGALDASRGLGREIRDALDARGLGGRLELRFCGERLSASPGNLLDKVAEAWGRRPGSAVLIAALPEGGASAVACTRHPAGREGEIAIDASRGGGHWDRYAASAEDGSEVEPAIHPWGPRVLSREQTRRISLLASALREHMGRDLEIELSLRGGAVEVLSVGTYRP
jgi:protein-tyrosine phosphatase